MRSLDALLAGSLCCLRDGGEHDLVSPAGACSVLSSLGDFCCSMCTTYVLQTRRQLGTALAAAVPEAEEVPLPTSPQELLVACAMVGSLGDQQWQFSRGVEVAGMVQ